MNDQELIQSFYQEFTRELLHIARDINSRRDGDRQDGFQIANIKDGWIDYKGMSFGFALLDEPARITCTFGPDGPFVGFQEIFRLSCIGSEVECLAENGSKYTPRGLAQLSLGRLSTKAADRAPAEMQ